MKVKNSRLILHQNCFKHLSHLFPPQVKLLIIFFLFCDNFFATCNVVSQTARISCRNLPSNVRVQ